MRVVWVRGQDYISFNRPDTNFVLGSRGSGKSSLLEHIAEGFLGRGHHILDLYGAKDSEGLCWLRSIWAKDKKILLIRGPNTDVKCSYDTKNIVDLTLHDLESYDIVISASALYSSPDVEFVQVNRITNLVYQRTSWKKLVYTICRESSNLFYSRLKLTRNQMLAKAEMIYLAREARHCGVCLSMDTLKYTSVDLDLRQTIDHLFFKSQGISGLPADLRFMYGFFNAPLITRMPNENFLLLTKTGALGFGDFPKIPWHKNTRENIVKILGLEIEHGEPVEESELKGTFTTVGDVEHAEIIRLYGEGLSMDRISKQKHRSSHTISKHVHGHDDAVKRSGFCAVCRRVRGEHAESIVGRF